MSGSTNQRPIVRDLRIVNPLDTARLETVDKVQLELVNQVCNHGLRHIRGAISTDESAVLRAIAAPGHADEACELLRSAPFAA